MESMSIQKPSAKRKEIKAFYYCVKCKGEFNAFNELISHKGVTCRDSYEKLSQACHYYGESYLP
jgi:hypothetical protein